MVPTLFCRLENMPLNASGKLDKKALEKIEIKAVADDFEEPINETERHICEFFKEVCGTTNIGRNTDFVSAGGTSIDMISLLSKDYFKNITAAQFIANSTPAMLSKIIENNKAAEPTCLHALYSADNAKKVLVLFPFAGGSAEAFAAFVNSFKTIDENVSIYYVDYLHSYDECLIVSNEIKALAKNKEVYFYSHCAGSAVAMQIMKIYQSENISVVKHFIAAANIPPKNVRNNLWNSIPDFVLIKLLSFSGANISVLSEQAQKNILSSFRKDTDFFFDVFSSLENKLKCHISVIVSKEDLFTINHRSAKRIWQKYVSDVDNVFYIKSKSHYFQSEKADEFAELIKKIIQNS